MGQIKQTWLRTPLGNKTKRLLAARIDRHVSSQAAAATLTDTSVLEVSGDVQALGITYAGVPAVGESLTVDIQKNGVTILTTPLVVDSTVGAGVKQKSFSLAASQTFKPGDIVTVIRTYVAGGGPTPIGPNRVSVEIA
jgi:hypothetical protein